jgi:hypothetical protein
MIDTKEAVARIAVAELEARSLERRSAIRMQRCRLATMLVRIVLALGLGIYLQVSHWQISGAQACGLFLIYLGTTAWQEYQMREMIHTLQAEVERLKDGIESKSA